MESKDKMKIFVLEPGFNAAHCIWVRPILFFILNLEKEKLEMYDREKWRSIGKCEKTSETTR